MSKSKLVFEGHVIRLTEKHYHEFWGQVAGMPENEFLKKLSNLDDWFHSKPGMEKKWFFILGSLLEDERKQRCEKAR